MKNKIPTKSIMDIVNAHRATQVNSLVNLGQFDELKEATEFGYSEITKFDKDLKLPVGEKNYVLFDPSERLISNAKVLELFDAQSDFEYVILVMKDIYPDYSEKSLKFFSYMRDHYILHKTYNIVVRKQISDADYDHDMVVYVLKKDSRAKIGFYIERTVETELTSTFYSHDKEADVLNSKAFNWCGYLIINSEKVHYSHRGNNKFLQMERGARGTSVVDHAKGSKVFKMGRQISYPKMPILVEGYRGSR